MTFAIDPGPLDRAFEHACLRLDERRFADALWARRLDVWTTDTVAQQSIERRLGWLRAVETAQPHLVRLRTFADRAADAGFTDAILLGMGGSSLAAEVLHAVIGAAPGRPRFHVLDSVDPDAVGRAMARAATSLFIVASKSGSTIEVAALAAEAERCVRAAGVACPESHFVAITDEGTPLHHRAVEGRFRDLFLNAADVGGRFSALTFFGLVPAALMGLDIDALLASARSMAEACRIADPRRNPGLALGAALAAAAMDGRDKLTLRLPAALAPLGLWVEQLIAESTGKDGKGIVPVIGESPAISLGSDRILVTTGTTHAASLRPAGSSGGIPSVTIDMPETSDLGAEFFRWEVATATAGFLLGVNPFDEPNVQQAKDATRALLDDYVGSRHVPLPEPDAASGGMRASLTMAAREALRGEPPLALLHVLRPGDYVALLAYLPPDDERFTPILDGIREKVAAATRAATTLGFGPRYLHSTGQLHKGGPNTGVFVILTADIAGDLPVPGQPYSFGVLQAAQAVGDFQALDRLGRRALLVRLRERDPALLQQLGASLTGGLG
ncbi:MAG: hypothetical protein A3G77_01945 [Acidobacteria bacterium RIFCSPLOWO2_12_FULL_68_19]|nr:MAG: hypothetical protein A3G77_01945 [Acidobacteria bacterium RIFCSPLOWO2_12_FULL_68_19]